MGAEGRVKQKRSRSEGRLRTRAETWNRGLFHEAGLRRVIDAVADIDMYEPSPRFWSPELPLSYSSTWSVVSIRSQRVPSRNRRICGLRLTPAVAALKRRSGSTTGP